MEKIHCITVGRDTDKVNSNNKIERHENKDKENRRIKDKPPLRFDEEFDYYCINVNYCDDITPENFQMAITCKGTNKWKEAMDLKRDSLVNNKVGTS